MFNFSSNHLKLISSRDYHEKARINVFMDVDTKRCYKVYDYKKSYFFELDKVYCISGKINSADQLYLILESAKEDMRFKAQDPVFP